MWEVTNSNPVETNPPKHEWVSESWYKQTLATLIFKEGNSRLVQLKFNNHEWIDYKIW